jgi:hypothetical protein
VPDGVWCDVLGVRKERVRKGANEGTIEMEME